MSVFIITSGSYSDYYVHGYCTTEEEAERYCFVMNNMKRNQYDDSYEYEEIECFDGKYSKELKDEISANRFFPYKVTFDLVYKIKDGTAKSYKEAQEIVGIKFCDVLYGAEDIGHVLHYKPDITYVISETEEFPYNYKERIVYCNRDKKCCVFVAAKKCDSELAKKIAQDYLYEKLAGNVAENALR